MLIYLIFKKWITVGERGLSSDVVKTTSTVDPKRVFKSSQLKKRKGFKRSS